MNKSMLKVLYLSPPKTSNASEEQELESSINKPPVSLATAAEVLRFVPDLKTKIYFGAGIICALVLGYIIFLPAMAFFLSNSFADLSGSTSK